MTTHDDILAMIQAITSRPTPETLTQIVEVMEALLDRIESLERQVRSVRLQLRPFKNLSAAGGKSVNRTPVKRGVSRKPQKAKRLEQS